MRIDLIPSGSYGVNTYLVGDEISKKAFLVDPGGHNMRTVNLIKEYEYDLEAIVLTHGHGDHIGGVPEYMKEFPKAKLVASKAEASMLADPALNVTREICGKALSFHPDILVEEGDILNIGNMELKFIMTPGHTPGGMCILVGEALFTGDTLFQQSIGRTDFPGGSYEQLIHCIKNKLFLLPDETKVYPGHMGLTDIGSEKRHNPFV